MLLAVSLTRQSFRLFNFMKYKSFRRLVVQIIPEPQEEISPGGIITRTSQELKNIAHGKVLSGQLYKSTPADRATSQWPSDSIPDVKPGDTVAFSKAGAMNDGKGCYFLSSEQVLAVVESD
jgi:co-chaperonin GroES (HSP10)